MRLIDTKEIELASKRLQDVATYTPLQQNVNLSELFQANIFLKREDLQIVRSYKIRGAYNKISSLSDEDRNKGIVCASAGNHAQGVAYSCYKLGIEGKIFMPITTPKQKVKQVRMFGKEKVEVILVGDTFDDSYAESLAYCEEKQMTFVHPFDDNEVIAGQGTVGFEILEDIQEPIDFLFLPIGGGGLAAGVGSYFKQISPNTKIIGVEPKGAPSMQASIKEGRLVTLKEIEKFVDGAAVQTVGVRNFEICKDLLHDIVVVPEGKVCSTIISLYNEEAIVVEPAGALSISALDEYKEKIKGKNVVCVVSGSNNDLGRMQEIKERSLIYEGLKHYFLIEFAQRPGALREFLDEVLGKSDDITHFEYTKKTIKESGPALVGIELRQKDDYLPLLERMNSKGIRYTTINDEPTLFRFLV